jgi:6-phosphogluconolactonase (cycloisomerase 2 family)
VLQITTCHLHTLDRPIQLARIILGPDTPAWTSAIVISNLQRSSTGTSIVLCVTLASLSACGGDGGISPGGQGHPTGYDQPPGYAYVASLAAPNQQGPGTIFQYSIDSSGSPTPLSTPSVPAGSMPVAMVSDPTGRYVYVVNEGDATISQYSVGAGGVLSLSSTVPVSGGETFTFVGGYSLSVDPNGHSLYVVSTPRDPPSLPATSIAQYAIGSDGTLSPLSPPVINVATIAGGPLTVDPSGAYAYLAGNALVGEAIAANGEVFQFSVAEGGELTPISSPTIMVASNPGAVAISPSGQTAYVLSRCMDTMCDGQVAEYTVGANGSLTPTGAITPTASHVIPASLIIDVSESGAYLLTNLMGVDTNAGAVYQYAVNSTGSLVPDTPSSLNVSSGAVTQMVLGANLYALSSNALGFASGAPTGGHIDHYSIGNGGLLTAVSSIPVAAGYPTAMTLVGTH